jgi:1-aminocyclopropane-1-carboxylate deaminase
MSGISTNKHFNLPSPLELVRFSHDDRRIAFHIKRDDLIHPLVSGNKWRKLIFNIEHAVNHNKSTITTCGGPWSNHLIATASACALLNLKAIGLVRGDYYRYESQVLQNCRSLGMELIYLSNSEFDTLEQDLDSLLRKHNISNSHFIPLGGANALGRLGCEAIVHETKNLLSPDLWLIPAGTGTTAMGMINALDYSCNVWIFPAIGHVKQQKEIAELQAKKSQIKIRVLNAHRNRFGKIDDAFREFIQQIKSKHAILFDPLYNGKMLELVLTQYADELETFENILFLHTGGLSGWSGFDQS